MGDEFDERLAELGLDDVGVVLWKTTEKMRCELYVHSGSPKKDNERCEAERSR